MNNKFQKIAVGGFLVKDDKVLIVRRSQNEKFLPGYYELPGGKVDFGENPATSLAREFLEETNLKVEAVKPYRIFSYVSENNQRHTVEIVYLVKIVDNGNDLKLSDAHDDYRWVPNSDLKKYKISDEIVKNIKEGFHEISTGAFS